MLLYCDVLCRVRFSDFSLTSTSVVHCGLQRLAFANPAGDTVVVAVAVLAAL